MNTTLYKRLAAGIVISMYVSVIASAAAGPRALVRTVTTSALGEAYGVHIHIIDIDGGRQLGVPLWLPGNAPASALLLDRSSGMAVTTVYSRRFGSVPEQHLATFGTLPLPPRPAAWFDDLGAGAETSAGFVTDGNQHWLASYSATQLPGSEAERGTIAMRPVRKDGAATGPAIRQLLPGTPVAGVTFNNNQSVAVLAWDRDAAQWAAHVIHAASRTGLRTVALMPGASRADGTGQSAALGTTSDEQYLLTLIPDSVAEFTGYASTLLAVDSESLTIVGDPIHVRGVPDGPVGAIEAATGSAAWITTRDPTSAFGFVTYIELGENGIEIKDDPSYTAVDTAPIVAAAGEPGQAAIAAGTRLELRTAGAGVAERRQFSAPIGAIAWHEHALLVAEGGRFHRLDASDLSIEYTIQLQSGLIDAIQSIPSSASDEESAEGLPDDADSDARLARPVLTVNPRIYLRARAAGYERRLLRVESMKPDKGQWSIKFDEQSAPWLRVDARLGAIPGGPHLQLDPGRLPQAGDTTATIELHAVDSEDRAFAGSPMKVRVQIVQDAAPLRRIAWVLGDPANRDRMPLIAEVLSRAPLLFAHEYAGTSASLDERQADVVVMDEAAAAQSLVTRRSVTEFVRTGGSLVFVRAQTATDLARPTEEWLRPFGVTLTSGVTLQQGATAQVAHPLARWWQSSWKGVVGRAYAVQSSAAAVLAANGSDPANTFASTGHYGLGRIAVFASPSILFDSGRQQRRFAITLFSWLARSAFSDDPRQLDSDGDGLPDWLEDPNRDAVHAPGETDWNNPDTDGDGIPDGGEDVNLNGVLDAGETSPLSADTDGDGIWDGADATPIPPFAAPLIATVFPNTAPAQGGRTIVIQGRNLGANQRVWFGERLARDVRTADASTMSVVVPPASPESQTRPLDIRIEDTVSGLEYVAAGAFTYSEPARVRLTLRPVPEASGPDIGVLSLRISSRDKVAIGRVALTLTTTPPNALTWGTLEPGVAATPHGRSVTGSSAPDGSLSIAIGASRLAQGMGEFVTIPWAYAVDRSEPVTVHVQNARVTADNGYPLQVDDVESFVLR